MDTPQAPLVMLVFRAAFTGATEPRVIVVEAPYGVSEPELLLRAIQCLNTTELRELSNLTICTRVVGGEYTAEPIPYLRHRSIYDFAPTTQELPESREWANLRDHVVHDF